MKRDERRQQIIDLLVENGVVDLEELAKRFAVSKMTIHRDLDELEAGGLLRKVRGGATIEAGMQFESDFRLRERQGSEGKERMALEALELVEPGMTVMVNDGSMAAMLGSMLPRKKPLTVITNNASILEEFVKHGVVVEDKVEEFQETYGDPEERACIFVVTQEAGGFVFVPYEIAEDADENPLIPDFQ